MEGRRGCLSSLTCRISIEFNFISACLLFSFDDCQSSFASYSLSLLRTVLPGILRALVGLRKVS
jgi:hypothetical protein